MDTQTGVTEWWLMRQQLRLQVDAVARALDKLVALDVLEEVGAGEHRLYRLKRT